MHKFIVFLIFAGLGYLGYVIWQDLEKKRTPPPVVATPTPTPVPTATPTPVPTPTPEARFAPEGVLFVVKRFSEPHDGGVRGFSPGTEVRLLRQEAGYFVVTDGEIEARRPRSWFTREIKLAEELRAEKALTDRQIADWQKREKEAYEAAARERAARWEAALASVEAQRRAAGKSAQQAAVTRPDLAPLRIGAWNLEFFGNREDPPRTDEDVQAIAQFIKGLDVQALALCEIDGEKPLKDLCRLLGPEWKFVVGTSGQIGEKGQIAPGFIWDDSRLEMTGAGELQELRQGQLFHRVPVVAGFRCRAGGPDFRMVAVHLKAGRTPEDFARREGEVRALRGYLEKLVADEGEDNDIIVVGDFNHCYSSGEAEIFTEGAFAEFLQGRGRSIIHFDRQIDHAVPLGTFEEVKGSSFTVHNREGLLDPEDWRRRHSDHFAVTVDLEAAPDDDRDAGLGKLGRTLN